MKEYTAELEVLDNNIKISIEFLIMIKIRVFDDSEEGLGWGRKYLMKEEKKSSRNKKHRVFDKNKNKKEKGIFRLAFLNLGIR